MHLTQIVHLPHNRDMDELEQGQERAPERKKRPKRKRKQHPVVRQERSLIDVSREFATEEQCLAYLERLRWPDGVMCAECGSNRISKFKAKGRERTNRKGETVRSPDRHLYQCLTCKHQFTATVGTIFNDTHLSLSKWFQAVAIMCEAKKGVSAMQLQRHMDIGSYRTAWYLNQRIREAMQEPDREPLTGTVEADETYVGGKYDRRRKRERWDKEPVFGIAQRGGRVRTWHVPLVNRWNLVRRLEDSVAIEANVYTDESQLYKRLPAEYEHAIVNHSEKEWVRGEVHTGTIDGYWGLLKRAIIGTFHRVSVKHLHRYLGEFEWRWNNREAVDLFARVLVRLLILSALPYAKLTAR